MNVLAQRLQGAVVWDLFSGSGSFGIECVSCGADKAVFLDQSHSNLSRINSFFEEKNCGHQCTTLKGKLPEALARLMPPVDIVFMDPPYSDTDIYSWIQGYPWNELVRDGGVVIAESGAGVTFDTSWQQRKYGDTRIHIMEVKK